MQISERMDEIMPPSPPPRGRRAGAAVVSALIVVVAVLLAVGILPRLQRRAEVQASGRAAEAGAKAKRRALACRF